MLEEAWGEPEDDPDVVDVCFKFPAFWQDSSLIVLQPERGRPNVRDEEYHDLGAHQDTPMLRFIYGCKMRD
jgi:cobaltochelatase CobN